MPFGQGTFHTRPAIDVCNETTVGKNARGAKATFKSCSGYSKPQAKKLESLGGGSRGREERRTQKRAQRKGKTPARFYVFILAEAKRHTLNQLSKKKVEEQGGRGEKENQNSRKKTEPVRLALI